MGKLAVILGVSLSLISAQAMGQDKAEPKAKNPVKAQQKPQVKQKKARQVKVNQKKKEDGINHELSLSLDYNMSNGTAKPAGTEESTITESEIKLNLAYGYLFKRNNLEPIIELEYNSFTTKIDDYSGTDITNRLGLGLLVNLPLANEGQEYGDFDSATWIPFIGFLLTNNITNLENGQTESSKVNDSQMITKLTFGNRYRLVENVTVNSWVRLSYENSDTGATDSSEGGAKTSKLKVEVKLISLSLLL